MITLREWATKTTHPEQTFDGVISKLRTWTSIDDLSLSEVWDYTVFLYGGLLIPDYPALTLKAMTTAWAAVNNYKFNTLADSTKQVYNPIENYDRYEDLSTEATTTDEGSATRTPNLTTERTPNLTTTDTDTRVITTESEGSAGSEGTVAAYDSANYSPDAKTESSSEGETTETHSGALTRAETGTDTTTETGTDTTESERTQTTETTTENHIHGNIGVTSAQDMLRQEREIANFVFLDTFLSEWAGRFTIGIYSPGCADATQNI